MLSKRIIPVLLLKNSELVKTRNFDNPSYVGDPINTVRIFNELEVDELILLDIGLSENKPEINFDLLSQISKESFMPLVYGGGIKNIHDAKKIFEIGYEKISINTLCFENLDLIKEMSLKFGSQAIIVSIDIKKTIFGKKRIWNNSKKFIKKDEILDFILNLEKIGVGELLLTSVDKEGTWEGLDLDLINYISSNIKIPLIAHGGIGNIEHIRQGLMTEANAIGIGSYVVYQKKDMGVLVNFPDLNLLEDVIKLK